MDSDLSIVIGIVIGAFSVSSIVAAFVDGRTPRVAVILTMIAGGLVLFGIWQKPAGYSVHDVPGAFVDVIGRLIN